MSGAERTASAFNRYTSFVFRNVSRQNFSSRVVTVLLIVQGKGSQTWRTLSLGITDSARVKGPRMGFPKMGHINICTAFQTDTT